MSGKILRFNIETFAGVKNINVEWPDDKAIVAILADGGLGKTSIKEFVRACLDGTIPEELINTELGKAKGSLEFVLDNVKHRVEISKTKNSETVKVKNEKNLSGGKEVLRSLVGPVSVDPFQFKKMKPEEQVAFYKTFFSIDTFEIDRDITNVFNERTLINRKVNELKGAISQSKFSKSDPKELAIKFKEEKNIEKLNDDLKNAIADNTKRTEKQGEVNAINSKKDTIDNTIQGLEKEVLELERQIKIKKKLIADKHEEKVSVLQELENKTNELLSLEEKDTTVLQQTITDANNFNTERLQFIAYLKTVQESETQTQLSAKKTGEIKSLQLSRSAYIREKQPEIPGLELLTPKFEEDGSATETRNGLYWNGKPVNVLSTTEAITLSIHLRKAINPKGLPILLIDDFEGVGSLGRAEIINLCHEHGYQALCCYMNPEQMELKIVIKNDFEDLNNPEPGSN